MKKIIERIQRDRLANLLGDLFVILLLISLIWSKGTVGTILDWLTTVLLLILLARHLYVILRKKEFPPLSQPGRKKAFFNTLASAGGIIVFAVFVRPDNPVIQWILNGVIVAVILLLVVYLFRDKEKPEKEY